MLVDLFNVSFLEPQILAQKLQASGEVSALAVLEDQGVAVSAETSTVNLFNVSQ